MRYALPVLAAFFLLAFSAGFLATRPVCSAKSRPAGYAGSAASAAPAAADDGWRRTVDGWERVASWQEPVTSPVVSAVQRIHPLVVAAMIVLVSLGVLVAYRSEESDEGEVAS